MIKKADGAWEGYERRVRPINDRRCDHNCFEHSGLAERMDNLEIKTSGIEKQGFLTISAYRWTTGLLVSILIPILSASLYTTFQLSETLREIKSAQQTLNLEMDYLKKHLEDIKRSIK